MEESLKKPKLKQRLTVANILNQKIERIQFTEKWKDAFGNPQNRGLWYVWGNSGSGKSAFFMQLAKELSATMVVDYNLLEEETDDSDYIERLELFSMNEVEGNFNTVSYNLEELDDFLSKRNSPDAIIIDSIPYLTKDWDKWFAFKKKWASTKLIIVSGHAKGKNPKTDFEDRVMFDAKMKIFISGYLATCKGRTIGKNGGFFIIWDEGYQKINGTKEQ